MIAYLEHENDPSYKLSVHFIDDGYLLQFVQGVNLVVQTWVETTSDVSDLARIDGFELGSSQLLRAMHDNKTIVDKQWQERID